MLTAILRKEHKNSWERRAPLTPEAVASLRARGYALRVERCSNRIFTDAQYAETGAELVESPNQSQFVLGIKEPPVASICPGQVHLAFSHTIKGQDYNMGLLQRFIDQRATLLDYEPITDAAGTRTIAFGRYAGIAGAIDALWVMGNKLRLQGRENCLEVLQPAWKYGAVETARVALAEVNLSKGPAIRVLVVGTGKVGKGAIEVCEWMGLPRVDSENFIANRLPEGSFYAVVSSRHIHRRLDGQAFEFDDFVERGAAGYVSTFAELLGRFNLLLQTPYWEEKYPRLLPLSLMQREQDRLPEVVGDISCDIDGSLACTKKATDSDHPVITFHPETDTFEQGLHAQGVAVMSIDNLPCELSIDASRHFSSILPDYVPAIMDLDLSLDFEQLQLEAALKRAIIVYRGELTPRYAYLQAVLDTYHAAAASQ